MTPKKENAPPVATPQKVRAVLKKAGHTAAVAHKSGQIRGWKNWTRGYRVSGYGDEVRVEYKGGNYGTDAKREQDMARYADTLLSAGFDVTANGYLTVRTAEAPHAR